MDNKEIIGKIKEYISKGQTENAINALVKYAKESDSLLEDEAILLSGQFRQWKKENMLGVQQTHGELRRIEMSIMDLLQEKSDTEGGTLQKEPIAKVSVLKSAPAAQKPNMLKIIGGILGLVIIAIGAWYFLGGKADSASSENVETPTEQTTPITKQKTPTPKKANKGSKAASSMALPLAPGTSLEVEKKYYSEDGNYYLKFQDDGNLCIYTSKEDGFKWGSFQAGAPLNGKTIKMQEDGNLVISDANGRFIWGTMSTTPSSTLNINKDGVLEVNSPNGSVVWKGE